ncbi:GH92 family glycosyl hydrolase [Cohnella sp. AR92]|uniref:GH92 family glycosyl hydrolase n=1 Tax=Cohnella sp. AR92 TaxID=648716 RepID=UPI000F8D30CE|nr:GH92 family glycosyl hydrolase [Cohnella sp. AR92]RUS47498.1 glycoside hydrolase family 92 protein [Cohnella sp. AR92]
MSYIPYVHPLQGTDSVFHFSNGNTLPLISRPFGMNAWSPQTNDSPDRWFFHPNDRHFYGLRLTHQPSPWIGDYACLTLMPQSGPAQLHPSKATSSFRPEKMEVHPDYFSIALQRYRIQLEMTPTKRGAALRLAFEGGGPGRILLNLLKGSGSIKIDPAKRAVTGWTAGNTAGAAEGYAMHFTIEFDCPISADSTGSAEVEGEAVTTRVELDIPDHGFVNIRMATSFLDLDHAFLHLKEEIGDRDFDTVRSEAADEWNERLSRIQVEDENEETLRTFYTCFYRTFLFPHTLHEPTFDGSIQHRSPYDSAIRKGPLYSDIGFWDVFRTSMPLMALLCPSELGEMLDSWVGVYRSSGWLPKWLSPGERSQMPGTLIDAVFADGYVKGVSFDSHGALEGLLKHAEQAAVEPGMGRIGLSEYRQLGYLPADEYHESVNNTLDYVYGDFCISRLASGLGNQEEADVLSRRASNYKLLFDRKSGFMRGKSRAGAWLESFDPFEWGGVFCEGSAWQCSWAVYHDLLGLADLMGGREAFVERLDELFRTPPLFQVGRYEHEIHEMSEMAAIDFGQFAISNQPSFHIPYIYAALGAPHKTQYWVRRTLQELFSYRPDGLPGDEDNGSMGAWYVWGALGIYPLCPGVPEYVLGSPLLKKAVVTLENGQRLSFLAENNKADRPYVKSVSWNGQRHSKLFVLHEQLVNGGELSFEMTDQAEQAAYGDDELPYSMSRR